MKPFGLVHFDKCGPLGTIKIEVFMLLNKQVVNDINNLRLDYSLFTLKMNMILVLYVDNVISKVLHLMNL